MSQNMMKNYLYSTVFVGWYGTVFHHFQHLFFATQVSFYLCGFLFIQVHDTVFSMTFSQCIHGVYDEKMEAVFKIFLITRIYIFYPEVIYGSDFYERKTSA